jgi:hypothetical protein
MTTTTHEMNEIELITLSDALAKATLQPLTLRTAAQIVQLAGRITVTASKGL